MNIFRKETKGSPITQYYYYFLLQLVVPLPFLSPNFTYIMRLFQATQIYTIRLSGMQFENMSHLPLLLSTFLRAFTGNFRQQQKCWSNTREAFLGRFLIHFTEYVDLNEYLPALQWNHTNCSAGQALCSYGGGGMIWFPAIYTIFNHSKNNCHILMRTTSDIEWAMAAGKLLRQHDFVTMQKRLVIKDPDPI